MATRICLALGRDGKIFSRAQLAGGEPGLFSGPYQNTRDPAVVLVGDTYYCYYTGHDRDRQPPCAVFCRTSRDLIAWSEPIIVCAGGSPATQSDWFGGDCESPFVIEREGSFVLFRNQLYGEKSLNTQYVSNNPLDFGVDDDRYCVGTLPISAPEIVRHQGHDYLASCRPDLAGIQMARLCWKAVEPAHKGRSA
ncbi:MAG: hypothetical protein O3A51_04680 [Verrucomicrobia bacterium]|nr:hypothetical protein [Verrucomicrobiota bacterium]